MAGMDQSFLLSRNFLTSENHLNLEVTAPPYASTKMTTVILPLTIFDGSIPSPSKTTLGFF